MRSALQLPPGLTAPRPGTAARDFDYPTIGDRVAAIAAGLGKPLLPWQRYVADVAHEIDPSTGTFRHHEVLVTVQRQAGKTDLDQSTAVANSLLGPRRRNWYTAQSGQHANDKWREVFGGDEDNPSPWDDSPWRRLSRKPRLSNGSMALTMLNGSTYRPHPPTADSMHSKQSDRSTLDEVWAFTEAQGRDLVQAVQPPMLTRRKVTGIRPQIWYISTEGTVESTFLNGLLERARAGDPTIALFDWGIGPDVDPTDLPAVAAAHPGFGHLFDMQELVDFSRGMPPGEFARAYGNRRTGATERVIPVEPYRRAAFTDPLPDGPLCFGAASGVDGVDTSIAVAIRQGDRIIVEIVAHEPNTTWAIDRLKAIAKKHPRVPFAIDPYGPSASLHDEASRAKLPMIDIKSASVAAAAQNLVTWITQPVTSADELRWRYRPHPALDAAVELATRRWVNDGAWLFGRRASVGTISALEAANVATWGVDHLPKVTGLQLG